MIAAKDIVKEYHVAGIRRRVLKDVSFTLARGEKLAVLGRNGAGKSTLIKIVGGVELPTSGTVERSMSLSWPLAFGGAFQGSLTGLDNLRFIARIYERDYQTMRDFVDDFAELGSQLAHPVKTYSSGMRARLGFALSLVIEFDCYLIDEVILVGDARFHRRCQEELFEKRCDRALMIASHDMTTIRGVCNRAIVITGGQVEAYQDVEAAVARYESL